MNKIEEVKRKIKAHEKALRELEKEKELLEDEQEISLKATLKKQKYWKIGNQDFYCVGEREYIEVNCYHGGGGFSISQGHPYDLEREETISRSGRERSTKEEFEEALKSQVDRISGIMV